MHLSANSNWGASPGANGGTHIGTVYAHNNYVHCTLWVANKQTKKKRPQELLLFSSHGWIMGRSSSHRSRSGVHCSPSHSSCFHGRKSLFRHSFLYVHHLAPWYPSNWNSRENGHVQEEEQNRLIIVFKLQIRGVWYIYIFLPISYMLALSKRLISDFDINQYWYIQASFPKGCFDQRSLWDYSDNTHYNCRLTNKLTNLFTNCKQHFTCHVQLCTAMKENKNIV